MPVALSRSCIRFHAPPVRFGRGQYTVMIASFVGVPSIFFPCSSTPVNHPKGLCSSYVATMRLARDADSPMQVPPGVPGGRLGRGLRIHLQSGQIGAVPLVSSMRSVWLSLACWASPMPMQFTFQASISLTDETVSRLRDPPMASESSCTHAPSALMNAIAVKKSGWELGVERSSPCHSGPSPSYPLVWSK